MKMEHLRSVAPEIAALICEEQERDTEEINLIASENYVSQAVLEAQGSILGNIYSGEDPGPDEPGRCEIGYRLERLAAKWARELFGAEHANVLPGSGSLANLAVMLAVLKPGDRFLAMGMDYGGHSSHGDPHNLSGIAYEPIFMVPTQRPSALTMKTFVPRQNKESQS